ncbi:hypothetical protein C468_01780 [Halorubrum kocurii JCM 14978]|uniref:Uncharacterized protein n=1 Tax=Halorubrum kocurii JCM 14978 TaxID=1230456 RepID=M0PI19_9EURY|nr:hypothetical protein C468_01780 [Halorubrum kocurii JCM 14978]
MCFDCDLLELFHSWDVRHAAEQYERCDRPFSTPRIVTTSDLHRAGLFFEPLATVLDSFPVEILWWAGNHKQRSLRALHLTG